MNGFQVLGCGAALFFMVRTAAALLRRERGLAGGVAWVAVWAAAFAAILNPEITVVVSRRLGIQRGADFVLYIAILAALAGFHAIDQRLRRLEADLTRITRHLALRDPPAPPNPPEPDREPQEATRARE